MAEPQETSFLPPGPGGEEGGKRTSGSRWPADDWGDDPYWKTEATDEAHTVEN
jgi:hypothetical protein